MKKIILIFTLIAIAPFTSCDMGNEKSSEEENTDEKIDENTENTAVVHSINVGDAKSIFKKSSGGTSKSSSTDEYWKINEKGEEEKLVLSDEAKKETSGVVSRLQKLSAEFLIMSVSTPSQGEVPTGTIYEAFFVNIKTERVFGLPTDSELGNELNNMMIDWEYTKPTIYQDASGMIYFPHFKNGVYKLDTEDFTLSSALADNQNFDEYYVTSDGYIYYAEGFKSAAKVRCPGGRIYPIGSGFICNEKIYSLDDDKKIYRWDRIGNNELKKEFVCDFVIANNGDHGSEGVPDSFYELQSVTENHLKKTVIFDMQMISDWYEFDGTNPPTKLTISADFLTFYSEVEVTKKAFYGYKKDDSELLKLDLLTYQTTTIPISNYEIHNFFADKEIEGLTFSGISYTNSNNIVGVITETGEVSIKFTPSDNRKVVSLIEIF